MTRPAQATPSSLRQTNHYNSVAAIRTLTLPPLLTIITLVYSQCRSSNMLGRRCQTVRQHHSPATPPRQRQMPLRIRRRLSHLSFFLCITVFILTQVTPAKARAPTRAARDPIMLLLSITACQSLTSRRPHRDPPHPSNRSPNPWTSHPAERRCKSSPLR